MNNPEFFTWLRQKHPDIVLTPTQVGWLAGTQSGRSPLWSGGLASGKTFAGDLWAEYIEDMYGDNRPPTAKMNTHNRNKHRKFVSNAWRRWGRPKKYKGDKPPRELRRSW